MILDFNEKDVCRAVENRYWYEHEEIRNACYRTLRIFMISNRDGKLMIGKLSGAEYDILKKIISVFYGGLG